MATLGFPLTFHGSTKPQKVGKVIVGQRRETEFSDRRSVDGVYFEQLVESLRPTHAPSRLQGMFSAEQVKDLNLVGAAEDYVYVVEPLGRVVRVHFRWLSAVLGLFFDGRPARGNKTMERLIRGYWSGREPPKSLKTYGLDAPEIISDAIRVLRRSGSRSRP